MDTMSVHPLFFNVVGGTISLETGTFGAKTVWTKGGNWERMSVCHWDDLRVYVRPNFTNQLKQWNPFY